MGMLWNTRLSAVRAMLEESIQDHIELKRLMFLGEIDQVEYSHQVAAGRVNRRWYNERIVHLKAKRAKTWAKKAEIRKAVFHVLGQHSLTPLERELLNRYYADGGKL